MAQQKARRRDNRQEKSEREFVSQVIDNKDYRKLVMMYCYESAPEEDGLEGLAKWLGIGARKMGFRFDDDVLTTELTEQVRALRAFRRTRFMGSLIGTASAAKKKAKRP